MLSLLVYLNSPELNEALPWHIQIEHASRFEPFQHHSGYIKDLNTINRINKSTNRSFKDILIYVCAIADFTKRVSYTYDKQRLE
jgi:hypothetical protein